MLHLPGLTLTVPHRLPPALSRVLERDLAAGLRGFARWGRFVRPVELCLAADQASLRGAAQLPTSLDLRGLCTGNQIWLLDPVAWPDPPTDRELTDLILHELAHALWNHNAAPSPTSAAVTPPTWFREGFAVVVAEGPPASVLRRTVDATIFAQAAYADDSEIVALGPQVYTIAAVAFDAWVAQFGRRGLGALFRQLRAGWSFARAFEEVCMQADRAYIAQLTASLSKN